MNPLRVRMSAKSSVKEDRSHEGADGARRLRRFSVRMVLDRRERKVGWTLKRPEGLAPVQSRSSISDFRMNRRSCRWRCKAAFTLLEVMIAIGIFSMVLVAIYSSWSAIMRSSQSGLKAAAQAQRTRVTVRALEESIGATQYFLQNHAHYRFQTDTSGDFGAISFVSYLPPSFPGSGLFGDQVLRRVTFFVPPEPRHGKRELLLQQTPILEPQETAKEPYTITLAPNVREFRFYFFDTNTMEWAEEWLWTNRLPKMVRVQMAFGDDKDRLEADDITTRTIYLASVAIPREAQLPGLRGGAALRGGGTGVPPGNQPRGGTPPPPGAGGTLRPPPGAPGIGRPLPGQRR